MLFDDALPFHSLYDEFDCATELALLLLDDASLLSLPHPFWLFEVFDADH